MSIKSINQTNISYLAEGNRNLNSVSQRAPFFPIITSDWVRKTEWPALPSFTTNEQKIVILFAVFPHDSNFIAFSVAGNYTVDWGDGTVTNYSSGVTAERNYDYNNVNLNSDTDSAYGYKTTTIIITPQGGANLTSADFGNVFPSELRLNNRWATGFLEMVISMPNCSNLGLRIATTNTPRYFNHKYLESVTFLTIGSAQFNGYFGFWLCDSLKNLYFPPGFTIGTSAAGFPQACFSGCSSLTYVPSFTIASGLSGQQMFNGLGNLRTIAPIVTSGVTSFDSFFSGCYSLKTIPELDTTSSTSFASMFANCHNLRSVPVLDGRSVTTVASMFLNCYNLQSIPGITGLGNSCTNFSSMFSGCIRLTSVPNNLDTSRGTNFSGMFATCRSLKSIPLLNTALGTDFSSMFQNASAIETIPQINTANATTFQFMFIGSQGFPSALKTIPFLVSNNVTNMNSMFSDCYNLMAVPNFNTSNVTNMGGIMNRTPAVSVVPAWDLSKVTAFGNFAFGSSGGPDNPTVLTRFLASNARVSFVINGRLSNTELTTVFNNLGSNIPTSQTLTITGNRGVDTANVRTVTLTAGSNVGTLANTVFLSNNMLVTGIGFSNTVTVTGNTLDDIFTLNSHGLSANTMVSFFNRGSLTGIVPNTVYYVSNTTENTFQVSNTRGGSIIDVTGTDGLANIRYSTYITSIVTNTSITFSAPASVSGAQSLTFRNLDTSIATHKGWSITF